jgi:replicative DNA helicase
MAKRLNTRVIMLVQLNRNAGSGNIEPEMHHIRDSGSVEEAADIILGLWRGSDESNRVHCKFLKNREGIRGAKFDLVQTGLSYKEEEFNPADMVATPTSLGKAW